MFSLPGLVPVLSTNIPGLLDVVVAPDASFLITAHRNGRLARWSLPAFRPTELAADVGRLQNLGLDARGEVAFGTRLDGSALLMEARTGRPMHRLASRTAGLVSGALSPDGTRFAAESIDGQVVLWDLATDREIFSRKAHDGVCFSIGFAADGTLYSSGRGGIRRWTVPPLRTEYPDLAY
jgi:WD40 repeat protein